MKNNNIYLAIFCIGIILLALCTNNVEKFDLKTLGSNTWKDLAKKQQEIKMKGTIIEHFPVPTSTPTPTPTPTPTYPPGCKIAEKQKILMEKTMKLMSKENLDMTKGLNNVFNGLLTDDVYNSIDDIVKNIKVIGSDEIKMCFPDDFNSLTKNKDSINEILNNDLFWKVIKKYSPLISSTIDWWLNILQVAINNNTLKPKYTSLLSCFDVRKDDEVTTDVYKDASYWELQKAAFGSYPL